MYIYNYSFPEGPLSGRPALDALRLGAGVHRHHAAHLPRVEHPRARPRAARRPVEQVPEPGQAGGAQPAHLRARQPAAPFLTDSLCGHSTRNLKMESLESALVKLRRVRFPEVFKQLRRQRQRHSALLLPGARAAPRVDRTATTTPAGLDPDVTRSASATSTAPWAWAHFAGEALRGELHVQRLRPVRGGDGRPGAARGGPGRLRSPGAPRSLTAPARHSANTRRSSRRRRGPTSCASGVQHGRCADCDFGRDASPRRTCTAARRERALEHTLTGTETHVSVPAPTERSPAQRPVPRRRDTPHPHQPHHQGRGAGPEVDCSEADRTRTRPAVQAPARGHLRRHRPPAAGEPARPRWIVMPRDQDDVCCYPGPDVRVVPSSRARLSRAVVHS